MTTDDAYKRGYAEGYAATDRELQTVFDLRWKADMRAIEMWQAAHPGKEMVWPDHADLVVWLLEARRDAEARVRELEATLQYIADGPTEAQCWLAARAALATPPASEPRNVLDLDSEEAVRRLARVLRRNGARAEGVESYGYTAELILEALRSDAAEREGSS